MSLWIQRLQKIAGLPWMGLFCLRKEKLIALFFLMEKQNLSWVWVDWWAFSDRSELLSSTLTIFNFSLECRIPRVCKLEALSHSSSVSPAFNLKYLWVFFFSSWATLVRVLLSYQRIDSFPRNTYSYFINFHNMCLDIRDVGSIPRLGRFPGGGHGYPL